MLSSIPTLGLGLDGAHWFMKAGTCEDTFKLKTQRVPKAIALCLGTVIHKRTRYF